jgi:hypothetical protein
MHWSDSLPDNACEESLAWARTQPDRETAWRECRRGDWMLWLIGYYATRPGSEARRLLVRAACACASLVRRHTHGRSRAAFDDALRTARSWALGRGATLDDVRAAAYAASAADATAATYAAYAAAADAAAFAADAASAAARERARARCADIVRRFYPQPPALHAERLRGGRGCQSNASSIPADTAESSTSR